MNQSKTGVETKCEFLINNGKLNMRVVGSSKVFDCTGASAQCLTECVVSGTPVKRYHPWAMWI
jgi:hypothetical protein